MNEEKFSGKASVYARFRPSYPDNLFEYLYTVMGFKKESVIADVGAGTGLFSRNLLERHSYVICVEPNEEMFLKAREKLSVYSNCLFLMTSAEDTGVESNSVDFLTAAQAFHWFDREKFKTECQRILKKEGKAVLVWNARDAKAPITIENAVINQKMCPNFKGFSGGAQQDPKAYGDFFKNGYCQYKTFQNDIEYDMEGFIGRSLSGSYTPRENEAHFAAYIKELKQLFQKYEKNDVVKIPQITHCYVGNV